MTIRFKDEMKSRLETLSEATYRSQFSLNAQTTADYVELNEWQIIEIQRGIKEADAGDFAKDSEVQAFFAHHK